MYFQNADTVLRQQSLERPVAQVATTVSGGKSAMYLLVWFSTAQGLLLLSEAQLEDIMLLRQLFLTKRCLLRAKRDQLMVATPEPHLHPSENVTRMTDLAEELKDNASKDQRLLYQMSRAFYCGVSFQ